MCPEVSEPLFLSSKISISCRPIQFGSHHLHADQPFLTYCTTDFASLARVDSNLFPYKKLLVPHVILPSFNFASHVATRLLLIPCQLSVLSSTQNFGSIIDRRQFKATSGRSAATDTSLNFSPDRDSWEGKCFDRCHKEVRARMEPKTVSFCHTVTCVYFVRSCDSQPCSLTMLCDYAHCRSRHATSRNLGPDEACAKASFRFLHYLLGVSSKFVKH